MTKSVKCVIKCTCIVLLLFGFFLILSISPILRNVRSVSKLHGKYIASHKFAKIELNINPDGHYDQKVTLIPSSKTDKVSGAWSFDNEDSRVRFDHNFMNVVDGFRRFDPNYAKPRESGLVIKSAHRWFFRIYIGEYKKVN